MTATFQILAHRGIVQESTENSLISLEKSLEKGFGLEIDIHRTKDEKLVVIHDKNLKRITGIDANVTEKTLEFIKTLTYKNKNPVKIRIATLNEVLNLFKNKSHTNTKLAIQLKDCNEEDIEKLIVTQLNKFNSENLTFNLFERVFIFDTTLDSAEKIKSLNPKIKIALSIGETKNFPDSRYPTIYNLEQVKNNNNWDIAWADEWESGLYSEEFIKILKDNGKTVFVVSPELHANTDPKHPLSEKGFKDYWKKLISWGVDGICTDHPTELAKLLKVFSA